MEETTIQNPIPLPVYDGEMLEDGEFGYRRRRRDPAPGPTQATTTLAEAFRTELRAILESDKFGPLELHRLAHAAAEAKRALLAIAPPRVAALAPGVTGSPGMVGYNPYTGSVENFGSNFMREIVAALPRLLAKPQPAQETLTSLLDARAYASAQKLTHVVTQIDEQIAARVRLAEPTEKAPVNGASTNGAAP